MLLSPEQFGKVWLCDTDKWAKVLDVRRREAGIGERIETSSLQKDARCNACSCRAADRAGAAGSNALLHHRGAREEYMQHPDCM